MLTTSSPVHASVFVGDVLVVDHDFAPLALEFAPANTQVMVVSFSLGAGWTMMVCMLSIAKGNFQGAVGQLPNSTVGSSPAAASGIGGDLIDDFGHLGHRGLNGIKRGHCHHLDLPSLAWSDRLDTIFG